MMKLAKYLGIFVALALVGAGCGTPKESAPQQDLPQQVVQLPPDSGKEAEPKSQDGAKQAEGNTDSGEKKEAGQSAGQSAAAPATGTGTSSAGSTGGGGSSTPAAQGGGSNGGNGGGGAGSSASGGSTAKSAPAYAGKFRLFVTENFGGNGVYDETVGYKSNQYLLDVMRDHLDVQTAYGGGFVNTINGTKSGYTDKSIFTRKKRDWFYFVNGSISAVGSDAYKTKSGDEVWWDYHDWTGSGSNTPCIVGSYPHPFTTGYAGAQPGTVVYYSGKHAEEAERVAKSLRNAGAGSVRTEAYGGGDLLNLSTNAVLVGTWAEVGKSASVADMFGAPTRTGLYASFDGGTATALSYNGKGTDTQGQAAILATGGGGGDTTPLWLVIGGTEAGLDAAVDTLANHPERLHGKVGVILNGSNAVGVPIAK